MPQFIVCSVSAVFGVPQNLLLVSFTPPNCLSCLLFPFAISQSYLISSETMGVLEE